MEENSVQIIQGSQLSDHLINQINSIYQKVFPHNENLNKDDSIKYKDDTFFIIVDDNGNIISQGRLRPVKVKLGDKNYSIQGIADIVSEIRGKGYGRKIMERISEYLNEYHLTGIGFCNKENTPFYLKCGFSVEPDLVERFYYVNKGGELVNEHNADVVYQEGDDEFMKNVLNNPNEKVLIPYPNW